MSNIKVDSFSLGKMINSKLKEKNIEKKISRLKNKKKKKSASKEENNNQRTWEKTLGVREKERKM